MLWRGNTLTAIFVPRCSCEDSFAAQCSQAVHEHHAPRIPDAFEDMTKNETGSYDTDSSSFFRRHCTALQGLAHYMARCVRFQVHLRLLKSLRDDPRRSHRAFGSSVCCAMETHVKDCEE